MHTVGAQAAKALQAFEPLVTPGEGRRLADQMIQLWPAYVAQDGKFLAADAAASVALYRGEMRAGFNKFQDALQAEIANGLERQNLILHPIVAVEVSTYRPFYILGEVNTPGQYPFRPDMTVLTAISIAGGFTYRAEQGYVGVTRDTGSNPVQYRAPLFALAQPGDVITVYERRF